MVGNVINVGSDILVHVFGFGRETALVILGQVVKGLGML